MPAQGALVRFTVQERVLQSLENKSWLQRMRDRPNFGWNLPFSIYLLFFIVAHLIGKKYTCTPVLNVYYAAGVIGLAGLFVIPFLFLRRLHVVKRILAGLLNVALGVAFWALAFWSADLDFMCYF